MSKIYDYGVIGMGPAGIGFITGLQKHGKLSNTICFEQGENKSEETSGCKLQTEGDCCHSQACSVISGIGGASTFSSGKISNYPAGSGLLEFFPSEQCLIQALNDSIKFINQHVSLTKAHFDLSSIQSTESYYLKHDIVYKYYDVYEYDRECYLRYIRALVAKLKSEGLHIVDNSMITKVDRSSNGDFFHITAKTGSRVQQFSVKKVILATGALDISDSCFNQIVNRSSQCFEIGVRIEIPNDALAPNMVAHGDLKLKYKNGRTYCVTEDGSIISYQTNGMHFLEGSRVSISTGYTNLAILIRTNDTALISSFLDRYRKDYNGMPIKQSFVDYSDNKIRSTEIATTLDLADCKNINELLPQEINEALKQFICDVLIDTMHISKEKITIIAPELKIINNIHLQDNFELSHNIFIIGAATGKFRGILQSYVSGIRCEELMEG